MPEVHYACLEKPFSGEKLKGWFLENLSDWELILFNWWLQKRFSRVPRNISSVEWSNFWSICLDFVQKKSANVVLLSKMDSQGFVKVRFLEKKQVSSELWLRKHWLLLSSLQTICPGFFGGRTRSDKFFGYRSKIRLLVLSKVQFNCPESFVEKFFAGLYFFSRTVALCLATGVVRITFYVCRGTFCREKSFL